MAMKIETAPNSRPALGVLLRHWRGIRGKSQLELAMDTGVSQKHVSFVETGRSIPSRQMVIDLSDALAVPLRDRDDILLAAGYAPVFHPRDTSAVSPELDGALQRMLRQQEPYPALVLDRYWNVVETNEAAPRFFGKFVDLQSRPTPRNLLHLVFDPNGLRPFMVNFAESARALLWRVRREAIGGVLDSEARKLLDHLAAYGPMPTEEISGEGAARSVVPLTFREGEKVISLFSLVTIAGAPSTITAEEIRLESMFLADTASEAAYLEFVDG
ncbi:helix-turn-helix transcriptional regulator [Rhizobium sp. BE258]|uniref:helix-turn-helix domain-containing protein n=1 Tax=Rhizobium sp. BE258 TaxID=2817722 RepID=UPI00285B6808|nr:helix-turn-helix transcriptional regulator [Rhizobium sp. BE258]MDR7141933.1 transcriptional regulator with XRE-family HTH domain [Rhizobium sp. BE258]